MHIYLDTLKPGSLTARVAREWNSGQELDEAIQRLTQRYGAAPQEIRAIWAQLRQQCGDASIGWSPASRTRREAEPGKDPAYCLWKGWSGPGQQLRELLAADR